MRPQTEQGEIRKRRLALALMVVAAALLIVLAGYAAITYLSPRSSIAQKQQQTPTSATRVSGTADARATTSTQVPSPLLFGTNLGLFNANDQFLTSDTTRQMMQQMHVRIIRIPVRDNLPLSLTIQAAQDAKSIGAVPLIVLEGMRSPQPLQADSQIVQAMNGIFGNSVVYYEFGNEDDWNGLPIDRYTAGWNQIIPQLKKLALNGKFVGPVSYQYSHDNLTAFLQGANPRPDAISWHEYTCSYKDPADQCLANIDKWTTHIVDARTVMLSTIGTTLPIMITEWNYAADQSVQNNGQPYADNKYNNAAFMTQWTTRALQTLAANGVFASMQYTVTNTALPLITYQDQMTTQGQAFQEEYQKMFPTGGN